MLRIEQKIYEWAFQGTNTVKLHADRHVNTLSGDPFHSTASAWWVKTLANPFPERDLTLNLVGKARTARR
eukprot:1169075-Pyramimonas_sp.AAC.1